MLNIRSATENDAHSIANINVLGWKTAYRGLVPDDLLDNLSVTEKRIQKVADHILETKIFLIAENETGVVGYLSGGKPRNSRLPFPYEIYTFYVHPDFQRQGVGTALMNAFKKKINGQSFCVYVLDGNLKGMNFYQKMLGVRYPEFDCDQKLYNIITHELCLGFKGNE